MKALIRKFIPNVLLERRKHAMLRKLWEKNSKKTTEEVFSVIYEKNIWGGLQGEFCSGAGSASELIVSPYVKMIMEKAVSEGFQNLTFVDLGCGDFQVGKRLKTLCSKYIGVDIVKPLIGRNRDKYGNDAISFIHLDIVQDKLPDGDVCFIRQVLQHLSNEQIGIVLKKLKKYRFVFITEHQPRYDDTIKVNLDKIHGGDTRVDMNSGVFPESPPFLLPAQELSIVLEIPLFENQNENISQKKYGVIRTYLYTPRQE